MAGNDTLLGVRVLPPSDHNDQGTEITLSVILSIALSNRDSTAVVVWRKLSVHAINNRLLLSHASPPIATYVARSVVYDCVRLFVSLSVGLSGHTSEPCNRQIQMPAVWRQKPVR